MTNELLMNAFADALELWEAKVIASKRAVPAAGELKFSFAGRRYRAEYKAGRKTKIFEISMYGRYVATGQPVERRVA